MKSIIILLTLFLCVHLAAKAEYTTECKAKYKTSSGWSKLYTVDVSFLTGSELNTATNSFKYRTSSVYAVIFWGQNEASVIELTNFLICGFEVSESCIKNHYGDFQGKDQDGDEWNICRGYICY